MDSLPAIGIDVGGTKIASGRVTADGTLSSHGWQPTPTSSQEDLLAALEQVARTLMAEGDVAGVGFGVPSRIDQVAHRVVGSVHVSLSGVDLAGEMTRRLGVPAVVDNDGNAAAVAEWRCGAGRGATDLVMLTLGTGIGGGLILDGKPYRGGRGAGAELGHMVVQVDGPPCGAGCDGHGHYEALASGRAADAAARELGLADGGELVERGRAGDEAAVAALTRIGRVVGAGMVSIVNIFNPELIVVGGGFGGAAGELVLGPARELVRAEALEPGRDTVRIAVAELGPEAGVIGAGLIAFEQLDLAA